MPRNKKTRPLSGPALRKYVRDLVEADAEIAAEPGRRITETLVREVAEARIRLPIPQRRRSSGTPVSDGKDRVITAPTTGVADTAKAVPAPAPPAEPPFDPYAFSAVAVMTREGRTGLLARLTDITSAKHLRQFADAQHLALPAGLEDPAELRTAILAATERRIADRRAAAS